MKKKQVWWRGNLGNGDASCHLAKLSGSSTGRSSAAAPPIRRVSFLLHLGHARDRLARQIYRYRCILLSIYFQYASVPC